MESTQKKSGLLIVLVIFTLGILASISSLVFAQDGTSKVYVPLALKNYPPIPTGKIVFGSNRDGNDELYRMNYDGSEVTRLTNNPSIDNLPDWSPDGSKIAFQSNRTGEFEIYTMNADGTNQTQITTLTRSYYPQWSPDGSRIAFYSRWSNRSIVYTMNPDGTGLSPVTGSTVSAYDPYWSPDGTKIAYMISGAGGNQAGIYTSNADGSNPELLFASTLLGYLAWSPDGNRLAIAEFTAPFNNTEIYIFDIKSKTSTRITYSQSMHNSVDWSPDGNFLIFHSWNNILGNFEIYSMLPYGSPAINITNHPSDDGEGADWAK